ncbi:MAG: SCP2 sterol-binding domain-containing protein [Acidimicrobiales bacterium]
MTAELLSSEWVELHATLGVRLPQRPGASAHLRYVVSDKHVVDVQFDVVFVDGRVVSATLEGEGEPDVVLTSPRAVLVAIVDGALPGQTALMQGKVKSSATGPLLPVLAVLQSSEWRELERAIAADTSPSQP